MYPYTIGFIESFLEQIYMISAAATGSVFLSLLLLAVFVRLVTQPLARSTEQIVQHQSSLDQVLNQQVHVIKQQLQGEDLHRAIERLYQRFSYSPLLAVRSLAGLAVQLPFLIAAYYMLDTTYVLEGTSLPLIGPLDRQDKVLFGEANLLPFVMLAINILALRLALDQNRRQNRRGIVIAVLFFLLLYDKDAGLVLYWTLTNALTLIFALYHRYGRKPARFAVRIPTPNLARFLLSNHILALIKYFVGATLAISWPMIDLMSKNETFFLAHSFSRSSIVVFLLLLTLVPTLILFLFRALITLWLPRFLTRLDYAISFGLFLLFSLYLINNSFLGMTGLDIESTLFFVLSILLALLLLQIVQTLNLRHFLPWICLLALVPALNFIYRAPSSSLFSAASLSMPYDDIELPDTPVFIIIFDEFSGLTLQTSGRQLNAQRYPGLAKLSEHADYFPNSLSPTHQTTVAVPSIASGALSHSGLKRDDNVLDMLRFVTDVNVQSSVLPSDFTQSSLNSLNADRQDQFKAGVVMDDLLTIYIYAIGHGNWTQRRLGDFPQVWAGLSKLNLFARKERPTQVDAMHRSLRSYASWFADVKSGQPLAQINFLHMKFPHAYYEVTAKGRPIQNYRIIEDTKRGEGFDTFESHLNVLHHNYLQQAQAADTLISNLIDALNARDLYDDSLIFVTADHGVSYSLEGGSRRVPKNERSWINLIPVPLFVKYPNQKQGRTIDSMVTTLDIAPTLLSVLGIEAPWDMHGETLQNQSIGQDSRSVPHVADFDTHGSKFYDLALDTINRSIDLFTEEGPIAEVTVNYTGNSAYNSLLGKSVQDDQVTASDLTFSPLDTVFKGEITFTGILKDATGDAIDDAVLAISQNGTIVSLTMSGRARDRHGYVPFSLPELETIDAPRELKMFEVKRDADGNFALNFITDLRG